MTIHIASELQMLPIALLLLMTTLYAFTPFQVKCVNAKRCECTLTPIQETVVNMFSKQQTVMPAGLRQGNVTWNSAMSDAVLKTPACVGWD